MTSHKNDERSEAEIWADFAAAAIDPTNADSNFAATVADSLLAEFKLRYEYDRAPTDSLDSQWIWVQR